MWSGSNLGMPVKLPKHTVDALRELMDVIGADEIQEIEIERGWWGRGKIRIVKAGAWTPVAHPVPHFAPPQIAAPAPAAQEMPAPSAAPPAEDDSRYHTLKSPMVGMLYRAPNPDAAPYVQEGDVVSAGQTLCIIEAMKIMNEIESDVQGRIVRVLAENAKPVEYNTPLFLIEPIK